MATVNNNRSNRTLEPGANNEVEDSPTLVGEILEGFVRSAFVEHWSGQDDREFRSGFMRSFIGLVRETDLDIGKFEPDCKRERDFVRGFWKIVDTWKQDRKMTVGKFVGLCVGYTSKFFEF